MVLITRHMDLHHIDRGAAPIRPPCFVAPLTCSVTPPHRACQQCRHLVASCPTAPMPRATIPRDPMPHCHHVACPLMLRDPILHCPYVMRGVIQSRSLQWGAGCFAPRCIGLQQEFQQKEIPCLVCFTCRERTKLLHKG